MAQGFPKQELLATLRCSPDALLPCKLDWPIRRLRYWGGDPRDNRPAGQTVWKDIWGVTWRKESPDPALMPFPIAHPLERSISRLDHLSWPDPCEPGRFADLAHVRPDPERLLVAEHPFSLFERTWLLAGMPNLQGAVLDRCDLVEALIARVADFEIRIAREYLRIGVEAAWIRDDYGVSSGGIFGPELWRRLVKPHLASLLEVYHAAGAPVVLHTCGNITPLIDDFLEIGLDAVDPLQPSCNRLDWIRRRTDGRMCLCGAIEAATLLTGNVAGTVAETHRRIGELGRNGGYVVGPDEEWSYPASTREAMIGTVEQYRNAARERRRGG